MEPGDGRNRNDSASAFIRKECESQSKASVTTLEVEHSTVPLMNMQVAKHSISTSFSSYRQRNASTSRRISSAISKTNAQMSQARRLSQETFKVDEEEDLTTAEPDDVDEFVELPKFEKHTRTFDEDDHSNCCPATPARLVDVMSVKSRTFSDAGSLEPNIVGLAAKCYCTHGDRKYMEDRHFYKYGAPNETPYLGLFCVFDGHGGEETAQILRDTFSDAFDACLEECKAIDDAQEMAYERLEDMILDDAIKRGFMCGSTATTIAITKTHICTANVGDSRAVLSRAGKPIQLSTEHKPHFPEERERICNNGGEVRASVSKVEPLCTCCGVGANTTQRTGRTMRMWPGGFSVSRAFGNIVYKIPFTNTLIAMPDINYLERHEDDQFIIIASDGFWDTVDNELAVDMCNKWLLKHSLFDTSDKLANFAYTRGSSDNITVMVVAFTHTTV